MATLAANGVTAVLFAAAGWGFNQIPGIGGDHQEEAKRHNAAVERQAAANEAHRQENIKVEREVRIRKARLAAHEAAGTDAREELVKYAEILRVKKKLDDNKPQMHHFYKPPSGTNNLLIVGFIVIGIILAIIVKLLGFI